MSENQSTIELSDRELQVLQLIVTGASNQEIARQLVISINTVKVHVRNIFGKLEVQSRTEASLRAIQEGLVTVTEREEEPGETNEAAVKSRTYLIEARPPAILPRWQQLYLGAAVLFALAFVILPLLPDRTQTLSSDLPVIPIRYGQPATPVPQAPSETPINRWVTHNPMPSRRAGLALVAFDQRLFAIGGMKDNNRATRLVEIFRPEADGWSEGTSKPTAAADVSAAVLADKIYVPGGCTNQGTAVDVLDIYDPETDSWVQGAGLPQARCGYGLVAFQDKLYLFGGWDGQAFTDTIFVFSPDEDSWTVLEETMPQPAGYMGAAILDDVIYIVGGYDGQEEFNTTYTFTPATGEWQQKASLQEKRGGLGLISTHNNLYAIGGGWEQPLDSSEKYDPIADSWTSFEAPLTDRGRNLGLTAIDTTIYAVGGWNETEQAYLNTVNSYRFLYQLFLPMSISK